MLWLVPRANAQREVTANANVSRAAARVTINVEQAPLATVIQTIARQAGLVPLLEESLIPEGNRVTLHIRDLPVDEAFQLALRGTGLVVRLRSEGYMTIVRSLAIAMVGTIAGTIVDAKTKRPLRGARVRVDGTDRAITADDGTYRVANLDAGSHTVMVKLLGYAKDVRTVLVQENTVTTADIALDPAATALDQVVVTGTVSPTERKAIPNAITVITAQDIEQRGITHIDQLFRGDVPGLFAINQGSSNALDAVVMFSRGATALSSASAGTLLGTNPIKTYVDGVEMADPQYLSQIDPKSIERIEILTGPQASTIYGSNALNGVMQIFTKRGTSNTPQFTLNLLNGWVENNFSSARTPRHDYGVQISGLEGHLSYNMGGSWNYTGPWTPAKQTARLSGSGGAKLEVPTPHGSLTVDMTLRRATTQNEQHGSAQEPATASMEQGWWGYTIVTNGLSPRTTSVLTGQTFGLTVGYAPVSWWSHDVGIGQDIVDGEIRKTVAAHASVSDTALSLTQTGSARQSQHYTMTIRSPIVAAAQVTMTAGLDAWQDIATNLTVSPQALTGTLTGRPEVTRQPSHNTGGFMQTQIGVVDRLFLTYGLRAEWNPNFGADAQPNYAPRYGIAYTQDLGGLTAKVRASYGRSTRPPASGFNAPQAAATIYGLNDPILVDYGNFDYYLASPDLAPEHQQGAEGGAELYLGTLVSLIVTRYNQTVDGLIEQPKVDSVRSHTPNPVSGAASYDASQYGYQYQYQYLNVGSIRNQGWELQGNVNTGPVTTRGTYSWTKSRVLGITPAYRAVFAGNPQYQPGMPFQYLPEHTWALGVAYTHARASLNVNVTGIGRVQTSEDYLYFHSIESGIRLQINRIRVTKTSAYTNFNPGYTLADISALYRLSTRAELVLQAQNVANNYTNNDIYAGFAVVGRQTDVGIRWHL